MAIIRNRGTGEVRTGPRVWSTLQRVDREGGFIGARRAVIGGAIWVAVFNTKDLREVYRGRG